MIPGQGTKIPYAAWHGQKKKKKKKKKKEKKKEIQQNAGVKMKIR